MQPKRVENCRLEGGIRCSYEMKNNIKKVLERESRERIYIKDNLKQKVVNRL